MSTGVRYLKSANNHYFEVTKEEWVNKLNSEGNLTKRYKEAQRHELLKTEGNKSLYLKKYDIRLGISCDCTFYSVHAVNNKVCTHVRDVMRQIIDNNGDLNKIE